MTTTEPTTTSTWLDPDIICPPEIRAEMIAIEEGFNKFFGDGHRALLERAIAVFVKVEQLQTAATMAVPSLIPDDDDRLADVSDAVGAIIGAASGATRLRDVMTTYARMTDPNGIVDHRVMAELKQLGAR